MAHTSRHAWRCAVTVAFLIATVGLVPTSILAKPDASLEALTHRLQSLAAAHERGDSAAMADLLAVAEQRRKRLAELADTDPAAVLENALPTEALAGMPPGIRAKLEREVAVEGRLQVLYEDGQGWSRLRHVVRDARGKRRSIHFAEQPPDLLTGDRVRVRGVEVPLQGGKESGAVVAFCCSGNAGVEMLAAAALPNTFGEQRTAVLLVRFQNSTTEGWTPDEARQILFGAGGGSEFFQEASYGSAWLAGDVFGTYTLPIDETCTVWSDLSPAAQAAAAAAGVNLSRYTRIVYAFPRITSLGCGFAAAGTIGGDPSEAWINGIQTAGVVAHELGHNFGLSHAHNLDCGGTTLGSTCTSGEYGDFADTMGGNRGHFNSFGKLRLGWLAPEEVPVVRSDGTYAIAAYETAPGSLPKALRIPKGTDPTTGLPVYYFLEYRQPLGWDAFLAAWSRSNITSGVIVRIGTEGVPNSSYVLDMTPGSDTSYSYDWRDSALAFGGSYEDAESGVTVNAQSGDGTQAWVAVSFAAGALPNTPPHAVDDSFATAQDTPATLAVLGNDWDPDQDPLRVASASAPARGSVQVNADGTVTYTPASGYKGSDSFTYTASDGSASDSAQVVVQVGSKAGGGSRPPRR